MFTTPRSIRSLNRPNWASIFPENSSALGLAVTRLIVPTVLFRPKSVPCGPREYFNAVEVIQKRDRRLRARQINAIDVKTNVRIPLLRESSYCQRREAIAE